MVFSQKLADQYRELKSAVADCLLLMQAGAFMQVMDEDARAVATVTGLKLQMAGVRTKETVRTMNIHSRSSWIYALALTCLAGPCAWAFATGNIDATNKYAWAENVGWHNYGPTHGGVTVHPNGANGYLAGYVWAENIGWIKLGTGTGPYANTTANNYGVNLDADGNLSGYAWSEIGGWINFHPTDSQVTINSTTGSFDGYAWSEFSGWIHFKNASPGYNVRMINLPVPTGVAATDGTYTNMVRVTWLGVAGATSYEILRNTTPDANGATILGDVLAADALVLSRTASATTLYYNDLTVVGRQSYYYWVRALSGLGVSALSYVGMGYAELGSGQTVGRADLTVSDMVFLPVNLTNGSPAGTVSYRLANGGPDTLTSAPVRFDFYMVQSNQAVWMAYNETNVTLAVGAEQLLILDASARQWLRVRGDLAGRYVVQARVRHLDLIGDGRTGSNTTDAAGTVLVRATGVNSPGRSLNDYDGDGKADLCLYKSAMGRWYAKLSGDRYSSDPHVGDLGMGWTPVPGDYDGDGVTDVAAYNRVSGQWLVKFTSNGLLGECWLGGPEFTAAPCDFDGDSKTDPLVYREADGYWLGAASSRQYALCDTSLGETGYQPVVADYDGDGLADPAVYNRTTGLWAISLSGRGYQPLVTGTFGGSGYLPATADYDGDGLADPAIYSPGTAHWQVLFSGSLATQGCYTWGDAVLVTIGGIPVPADYDGDGKADLAVYHQDTGLWELYPSTQGYQLIWGFFGGPEYQPVTE